MNVASSIGIMMFDNVKFKECALLPNKSISTNGLKLIQHAMERPGSH
jgi:hypothetical protein